MNVFQSITISEINLSRNCVNFGRMQDFIWYKNVVRSTINVLASISTSIFLCWLFQGHQGSGVTVYIFTMCFRRLTKQLSQNVAK